MSVITEVLHMFQSKTEVDDVIGKTIASCQDRTLSNSVVSEQSTIICCVDMGRFGNGSMQLLGLS